MELDGIDSIIQLLNTKGVPKPPANHHSHPPSEQNPLEV